MKIFNQVSIDRVKDYWNQRPCNIRHSLKPIGTREYFDEVEARKYFVEPHILRFAEFERWRGKNVLEVGCGIGTDTINFARHGARVTAVDLSEASLDIARQRAEVYGLQENICFYQADAEHLRETVPLEQYDLIYSFGVIHHTPHPENVLAELRHFARQDTTLKIMVYHKRSWKVLWILLTQGKGQFWKLNELVATNSEAQTGCPVTYTYTQQQASEMVERHGFTVVDTWVDHIFPYRIPDYVRYEYVRVWYFRWMPRPLFSWLEHHFGWHLCLTAQASGDQG